MSRAQKRVISEELDGGRRKQPDLSKKKKMRKGKGDRGRRQSAAVGENGVDRRLEEGGYCLKKKEQRKVREKWGGERVKKKHGHYGFVYWGEDQSRIERDGAGLQAGDHHKRW